MFIAEVTLKKSYLEDKIKEVTTYLDRLAGCSGDKKGDYYTEALIRLFGYIEKLQAYNLLLDSSNKDTMITVGDSNLSISTAIRLSSTLENKIISLTHIINNGDVGIDMFKLMDQRDSFIDEYVELVKFIRLSDWSTEVD